MKIPLFILVCAGLAISGAAQAGEININQQFSGSNVGTALDLNDDGAGASVATFQVKGSPGRATILSQVESTGFAPDGLNCPAGELERNLIYQAFIETFNDLSMLFYETESAFTCFDPFTGEIDGQLVGIFTGGTGRFVGATGSWTVDFEAFLVGQTMAGFTGTITGTVEVPD